MHPARELWTLFEPLHAVTYFTPEAVAEYEAAGLRGYWRGYFAGRAAALGPVGAEPVVAAFFSFAPSMVRRALPDVWSRATPEATIGARRRGAVAALRRVTQDGDVSEAVAILDDVVDALDLSGRVLGAAHAGLERPDEPYARLWHDASVLREHRGDGHVAAWVAHDVSGLESIVLRAGIDIPRSYLQPFRGWTDEEWEAAARRLRDRGLLDADGTATHVGQDLHDAVEAATDAAAIHGWPDDLDRVRDVLAPLAKACADVIPAQSPLGLPAR